MYSRTNTIKLTRGKGKKVLVFLDAVRYISEVEHKEFKCGISFAGIGTESFVMVRESLEAIEAMINQTLEDEDDDEPD